MSILFVSFFGEILTVICNKSGEERGGKGGVKAKQMDVSLWYRLIIDL